MMRRRYYPHLPAPGLDWIAELADRRRMGIYGDHRAAMMELLELARFGLANGTHNKFAEIDTEDIDRAMAELAVLQTS